MSGDHVDPFGDDEALTPEVVDQPAGGQVVPLVRTQIDRAAAAALAEPGIPGRDDFLAMAAMARMLSLSPLSPKHIRGEPYSAFLILLTARDLGISVTYAIRKIVPIEGIPSIPPELQRALVRRKNLGDIEPHPDNDAQAVPVSASARAVYPDGKKGPWATFTWQDAQIAGLVDPDCESPLAHTTADGVQLGGHVVKDCSAPQRGGGTRRWKGCYCKENYRKYPRRMLWQRVQGYVTRDHFPEATLGLYTPDELGVITDEDGFALDVAAVDLPPGYVDPADAEQARADQAQQQQTERDKPGDPADCWALQVRIRALPDALQGELADAWKAEGCNLKGYRVSVLPRRLLGNARAMVNAYEAKAKAGGVDIDEARTMVLADVVETLHCAWGGPRRAAETPAPDGGPDGALEAPEAQSEPQGAGSEPDSPEPEATTEPGDEQLTEDEKTKWREIAQNLAAQVRKEGGEVPHEVLAKITGDVKALHHAKVNTELRDADRPVTGPIDLRRMEVALLRIRAWKAEQAQPGPEPEGTGDVNAELCTHGFEMGYCTAPAATECPHAEPF